jgi:hypothetical protein
MIYEAGAASVLFDELDDTTGEELKKMTSAQIEKYIKQDTLSIIRNSVSEYEQLFPDKEKQKKAENILTDMYMRALQL